MDQRLYVVNLFDCLHCFWSSKGTGTAAIKVKLAIQLAYLEKHQLYRFFLYLRKAFDAMDRSRCLNIHQEYGVGPNMLRLIGQFWEQVVLT